VIRVTCLRARSVLLFFVLFAFLFPFTTRVASEPSAVPPAPERVKWRLQLPGDYTLHRVGVGPDGTVYAAMAYGQLHAVDFKGVLQWSVQAGAGGGAYGPAVVGSDGTIYVAGLVPSQSGRTYTGGIFAYKPDGTQRWVFNATGEAGGIIAGPGIGPDGNIYAVAEYPGIGLFSLTPAGGLRFSTGAFSEYGQVGEEIVFSTDRLFFAFDMYGLESPKLFSYDFGGTRRFGVAIGGTGQPQPAVGPNENAVVPSTIGGGLGLSSFAPNGSHLWTYYQWPGNTLGRPDAGLDNVTYVARNLATLLALNSDGSEYWRYQGTEIFFDPIARPDNRQVFTGGRVNYGQPGFFMAFDPSGVPQWRIDLPDEPGFPPYGQLVPISRPAFSPDANTVYTVVDVAGDGDSPNPYAYLYAVDTTEGPPPMPPDAPTNLAATGRTSSSLSLGWADNSGDETGFLMERCRGAGCAEFRQIASLGANVTGFVNSGLRSQTVYCYRVRATSPAGHSAYSNRKCAVTRR
jgi:hypothetical protein